MIETRKLTKRYGHLIAANEIDLKLDEGDVFGVIGPNGSGKTTTMRMIATLLNPDYGEAYICGKSIYTDPQEIRRLVGYMPDFFGVYDDMTVMEYLEFFASAYRINGNKRRKVCEEKLDLVDMAFKRDAMLLKALSVAALAFVYLQAPPDFMSLGVIALGILLNARAASVLGIDRTYYGHELAGLPARRVTEFPYSLMSHPMIVGNVMAFGGTLLNPAFRAAWWPLAALHVVLNLGLLAMERAGTRHRPALPRARRR